MTNADQDDKRRSFTPRPLAALLPGVVRPAFRRRNPATARLTMEWPAVVGPALASVTAPHRLFQGTLAIAASGPVALEMQHLSEQLIQRVNAHLGRAAVTRLRFVRHVPEASAQSVQPAPPPARANPPALPGLPPGPLREALERLARALPEASA